MVHSFRHLARALLLRGLLQLRGLPTQALLLLPQLGRELGSEVSCRCQICLLSSLFSQCCK